MRDMGRGSRDKRRGEGAGKRDRGRGSMDGRQGTREQGKETDEKGAGKRDRGRGSR